ncbi:MAG: RNA 2',3'-cyclic phosphodiesterase [Dehalococcoidia bacterium]
MMESIRAFIALELPSEVKDILSELLDKIRPGQERVVKWVDPKGIHLTLKFLGDISPEKISALNQAIETEAAEAKLCMLELQGLGAFPNLRSPRVVWVGVGGDVPNVVKLQKQLDQALVPLGFAPEARDFSPHLTLGRVRDQASSRERGDLGRLLSSMQVKDQLAFRVDRINLMKSTLMPGGPIYERLFQASLGRG